MSGWTESEVFWGGNHYPGIEIGFLGIEAMVNPHPKAELGFNPSNLVTNWEKTVPLLSSCLFEWHFRSETSLLKEDLKELGFVSRNI